MSNWLLVETFGAAPPSVIGIGSTPKNMVPLRKVLARGHSLEDIERVITDAASTQSRVELPSARHRHIIGEPLITFTGHVHGVYIWSGSSDQAPPPHDPAGAWYFNLTTDVIGGSDDLLDLYGVPAEQRRHQRHIAEAFTRLVPNTDVAAALAKIVRSQPGEEHQAIWTVVRDDGQRRAAHFSTRAIAEQNEQGKAEVVLRGITHDIGPAEETPAATPPVVLEQRVLDSMAEPGHYRAIVNLKNLRIIRWLDDPMPGLGWELDEHNPLPWIHDDDRTAGEALTAGLATAPKTTATLRFRGADGGWKGVFVAANLVLLDQHTTAALLTMSDPDVQ
jgi:PAS domain-containing protein